MSPTMNFLLVVWASVTSLVLGYSVITIRKLARSLGEALAERDHLQKRFDEWNKALNSSNPRGMKSNLPAIDMEAPFDAVLWKSLKPKLNKKAKPLTIREQQIRMAELRTEWLDSIEKEPNKLDKVLEIMEGE